MKSNNPNNFSLDVINFRHQAKKALRSLFDDQGFVELDTPYLLKANTPDPFIDPVLVRSKFLGDEGFQLHSSPEIWLKKGIGLGLKKLYHMARVFRDEAPGSRHSIEFTMLEWYRTEANLSDLIKDCEDIFAEVQRTAFRLGLIENEEPVSFLKLELDVLFRDLARISLPAVLHRIAQGEADCLQKDLAKTNEYLPKDASFCDAFFHVMLKYIEPALPYHQPVVISRWPIQLAALSAVTEDDPNYCDRFEIYFRGLEIANAYQECNDSDQLRQRFIKDNYDRELLGKPCFPIDENFLRSVDLMPKTAGIALGVDRLMMAILNKKQISEIIFGFRDHDEYS